MRIVNLCESRMVIAVSSDGYTTLAGVGQPRVIAVCTQLQPKGFLCMAQRLAGQRLLDVVHHDLCECLCVTRRRRQKKTMHLWQQQTGLRARSCRNLFGQL